LNKADSELPNFEASLVEVRRLREENARLRGLLIEHRIRIPDTSTSACGMPPAASATPDAPTIGVGKAEQRIALFRSLFRGRDDVYAIRWENADGRSGYMPKADRDWKSYLRARDEERKKVDHQTRKFRPITDEVVRGHLVGDHTIGIYPLLQDETCWFLAVDFDKKTWQMDATAFLEVCRELNVSAALERSRSGNGGHVWIFLIKHFLPQLRENWDVQSSPEPWSPATKWDWIHTTVFSLIRTQCPKEGLAT
jgi:hypothetical protein